MPFTKEDKTQTIKDFAKFDGDTGSTEVQIAILTGRINALSAHLTLHKKDNHSQRGLKMLVGQRNRLTRYLRSKSFDAYRQLIERLGLRR